MIREFRKKDQGDIDKLTAELQDYFAKIDSMQGHSIYQNRTYTYLYVRKMFKDIANMNGKIFVAEENNQIVGFVQGVIINHQCNEHKHNLTDTPIKEGWIGLLFVKPKFRHKGIGQSLLDTINKFFRKEGCVSVRLLVLSDNASAKNMYAKNGFKNHATEMILKLG